MEMIPTFDEWYTGKHGFSFDHAHKHTDGMIAVYFEALSRELRDYHSSILAHINVRYQREALKQRGPGRASGRNRLRTRKP